ncbi:MAG: glycoside hydrolase family 97 protein [Bacteroidia bacterium]
MRKLTTLLLFISICFSNAYTQVYTIKSPDGNLNVKINLREKFYYSLSYKEQKLLKDAPISITLDNNNELVNNPKVITTESVKGLDTIKVAVPTKRSFIKQEYNESWFITKTKFYLTVRVYNNGMAYRWEYYGSGGNPYKVLNEEVNFKFQNMDTCYFQREDSMYSHNERVAEILTMQQLAPEKLGSLPIYAKVGNVRMVITESDLYNYAGLWLQGNGENGFVGVFPKYPKKELEKTDRDRIIIERQNYIGEYTQQQSFPWRIIAVAEDDKDLINNQLVYQLNRSTKQDFSWVKPGKVAWDWWNDNNIYGVDFKAGINTATYKHYIDFAAKNGLEYIILDEGWYNVKTNDVTKVIPDINMTELCLYAKSKNVGIILWVTWLGLDKRMNEVLNLYKTWGIKGVKVDFMQRDDQEMVNFYERVAKACAERQLLVDFHGAYKPTGMEREYPNIISREGVYGLEQSKWDKDKKINPEHNVTIPFIRMFAGAMDYTPGAMHNANAKDWQPLFHTPMSLGTRCHQLAMYVVYESPLQMLSDSPTNYEKEPACLDFLSKVPTIWSETVVKEAKIGDYIMVARKAMNGDWYVGAMTDWTARPMRLYLDFLDDKATYDAVLYQDGINADRNANDFKIIKKSFIKNEVTNSSLARGGGFVIRFVKKEK